MFCYIMLVGVRYKAGSIDVLLQQWVIVGSEVRVKVEVCIEV